MVKESKLVNVSYVTIMIGHHSSFESMHTVHNCILIGTESFSKHARKAQDVVASFHLLNPPLIECELSCNCLSCGRKAFAASFESCPFIQMTSDLTTTPWLLLLKNYLYRASAKRGTAVTLALFLFKS